jgi:hypothetical protein
VAAEEDHPQAIIGKGIVVVCLDLLTGLRDQAVHFGHHGGESLGKGAVAPEDVERLPSGHLEEPRRGAAGNAVVRPTAEGGDEGVLRDVLGEREVRGAEDPGQHGSKPTGLLAKETVHERRHLGWLEWATSARRHPCPSISYGGR